MTISFSADGKIATFQTYSGSETITVPLWNWYSDTYTPIEEFRIPASKGNDIIQLTLSGSNHIVERDLTLDDLTVEQGVKDGKPTRDLIIKYNYEEIKESGNWVDGSFIHDTETKEQRIVLQNYFTSTAGTSTSLSYSIVFSGDYEDPNRYNINDIYQPTIAASKNTIGTIFSDKVTSTENDETFTLKQGNNTIKFNAVDGFGKDTVVLTKGETLNLQIVDSNNEPLSQDNINYSVSNNDLIIKIKDDTENSIKVKNYAKTDSGATLQINGVDFASTIKVPATGKNLDTFTGTRLDDVAKSTEKSETFKLGTGKDRIDFSADNIGKDTIVLTKGEELILEGLGSDLHYERNGNNIIIKDSSKEGSSITIKDYLKDTANVYVNDEYNTLAGYINLFGSDFLTYGDENRLKSKKAVKLTGTMLDETFYGSAKNDTIKAGKGFDTLIGGKGNDKLYGGEYTNVFDFYIGDGKDTVYAYKSTPEMDTSNIITFWDEEYTWKEDNNSDENNSYENNTNKKDYFVNRTYSVKGNDVVITSEYYTFDLSDENCVRVGNKIYDITDLDGLDKKPKKGKYTLINDKYYETSKLPIETIIKDTVTVKDYLKGGYNVSVGQDLLDVVNDSLAELGGRVLGNAKSTKAQTIKGNILNEVIYGGSKADKIYTSSGADDVYAGKGNDTIYLNGEGEKLVYINKNEGNDVIYMNYDGVDANIRFDFPDENSSETPCQPEFKFKRTGDDLIINRYYSDEITDKNTDGFMGTTTIKNYFNNPTDSILRINDTEFSPNFDINAQDGENRTTITYDASNLKSLTFNGYDEDFKNYNWYVDYNYDEATGWVTNPDAELCTNFNWEIYGSKGNDDLYLGSGNDSVYEKYGTKNSINTFGGGNDYYDFQNAGGWISDDSGDDTYNVTGMNKILFITDNGGDDTLNIVNTSADKGTDLTFLFNVDRDGNIENCTADAENGSYKETSQALMIFNQANIDKLLQDGDPTGFIYIRDYFAHVEYSGEWNPDTGNYDIITNDYAKIEHITQTIDDTKYNINISDEWVNSVCANVATWLAKHTEYNDAMDVIESDKPNIADITSLLECYQVEYQKQAIN